MLARAGFTLIELSLIVVIIGIIAALAVPNYVAMQVRAKEANVTAQAHVVQVAAEDQAAANEGVYSDDPADIVPRLPGAQLLENAFSGHRSEPRFGVPADGPGQVSLEVYWLSGAPVGYVISCFGRDQLLLTFTCGH